MELNVGKCFVVHADRGLNQARPKHAAVLPARPQMRNPVPGRRS